MSLEYRKPIGRLSIAKDQRRRYEVKKGDGGWFMYDAMVDVEKNKEALFSFIEGGTYLEFGNAWVTELIRVDRKYLKGLILRPILPDMAVAETEEDYEFSPDAENWDLMVSEDGLGVDMIQKLSVDGSDDPQTSYIRYNGHDLGGGNYVGACPNVFFFAGVKRQALSEEDAAELKTTGYSDAEWTNIIWGNNSWCLHIPLVGRPQLYENIATLPPPLHYPIIYPSGNGRILDEWVPRQWTEGELSKIDVGRMAGEGYAYKIGVIGNAIAVTESSFEDSFAYYVVGNRTQPIVPAGPIVIHNWPGQAVLRLSPLLFRNATIYRFPFYVETIRESDVRYRVFGQPKTDLIGPMHPTGVGVGANIVFRQVPDYSAYLDYQIEVSRGQYPQTLRDGDIRTYTTPFIEAVTVWQHPHITDNGEPVFTDIDFPYELSLSSELGTSTAQTYNIVVDNRLSLDEEAVEAEESPTADLKPGGLVKVIAGWSYTNGTEITTDLGHYWIVVPRRDATLGSFDLTDIMGMLALSEWDRGRLCFVGWNPAEAIEFLLNLYGIGSDWYDIEDLGLTLYGGQDPSNPLWTWKAGTPIVQILTDLAEKGGRGAAIWYDGSDNKIKTGCKYCRTKRSAFDWYSHQDNGWNSTGCRAADITRVQGRTGRTDGIDYTIIAGQADASNKASLNFSEDLVGEIQLLRRGQYANRITVIGQALDGRPLSAYWQDDDALYEQPDGSLGDKYIGFPVSRVVTDRNLQTQDAVNLRLVELAHELGAWPFTIQLTIPMHTSIKPGYVIKIEGGKALEANGEIFRVQNIQHDVRRGRSEILARHMVTAGDIYAGSSSSSSSSA